MSARRKDRSRRFTAAPAPTGTEPPASTPARVLLPADGAVVESGGHVCVYCAPCMRWVDCYDGIPPEVVLDRHAKLLHRQLPSG